MHDQTTRLLQNICQGDRRSIEALMPLVYDELKAIAAPAIMGLSKKPVKG